MSGGLTTQSNTTVQSNTTALDVGAAIYYLSTVAILVIGWQAKEFRYLTAENGFGYFLGILGGSMMLSLLLYPLRKRWRLMRRWGGIRAWFRLHMLLGVIGPVAILFHSNFGLGSMNSTVALVSMLLVAGSGLVGRYFYGRIHHGLYGRRISLTALKAAAGEKRLGLRALANASPGLSRQLDEFQSAAQRERRGLIALLFHMQTISARGRRLRKLSIRLAREALKQGARSPQLLREVRVDIDEFVGAHRQVAKFQIFERLFGLWHIFHLPLFFMLVITGVVHVFAVHLY
ncbi:MAG: pyridine nucleotide-disulfide oxidoreductase [Gammaproteobacteria bacterium]|nr:pyridine nucleotide-disulfide oxidoreductase [Gammaproteobacteria bacterium]